MRRSLRSLFILVSVLPLLPACNGDSTIPEPPTDTSEVYWSLDLDHRAVTLAMSAPHDTLMVTAAPRNPRGVPISGLPTPRYTSRDVEHVIVTPEGQLIAAKVTSQPVWVIARLVANNLAYADSLEVKVVAADPLPVLTTFSIGSLPPDSAKTPIHVVAAKMQPFTLAVRAADADGAPLTGLPLDFRSSDPRTATIDRRTGVIVGQKPGTVMLSASMTAFHVTKADTIEHRIGWPVHAEINVRLMTPAGGGVPTIAFTPSEVRVGRGAMVVWNIRDQEAQNYDVVFNEQDTPNVAPVITYALQDKLQYSLLSYCQVLDCVSSGSAASTSNPTARVFPNAGTYEYHSDIHGVSGRIVVVDEP